MSFKDLIKRSVLENFTGSNITTTMVVFTLAISLILGLYIFAVYYFSTKKTFYNKTFNVSLPILAVITASIVLTMQSNLAISLGMVGALSIVRFRTAIKDTKDLVFLFWSISVGIICGGGIYEIAIISSLVITIVMFALELLPVGCAGHIVVVNASNADSEAGILDIIKKHAKNPVVRSRNASVNGADYVVECRVQKGAELLKELSSMEGITNVSVIDHDGEVNF